MEPPKDLLWIAVAAAAGLVVGWLIRELSARWETRRARNQLVTRMTPAVVESEFIRKELARLRGVEAEAKAHASAKDEALARVAGLESRIAELDGATVETERWERSLAAERAQRAALHAKMTEAVQERDRSERDRLALAARLKTLEDEARHLAEDLKQLRDKSQHQVTESEISKALVATEVIDLKKRLATREVEVERVRRELAETIAERARLVQEAGGRDAQVRTLMIRHQTELADRDTRIGALEAEASRVDPLRRQVEDRESLLRALAEERDRAMATVLEREREMSSATEQLERTVRAERRTAAQVAERETRIAALDAEVASLRAAVSRLMKEKEDRTGATVRIAQENETLKGELRDRDVRFQALLNDRRLAVESYLAEISRLREQLARVEVPARPVGIKIGGPAPTNGTGRDDLKQISGIGPAIEKLLNARGITTFLQIANWNDEDVARISAELGAFRDRVHRDRWVEQARVQHQLVHGELVA